MGRGIIIKQTGRLTEVIVHIPDIMYLRVGAEIISITFIFTADIEPHLDAEANPLHRGGIDIIPYQRPGIVRGPGKYRIDVALTVGKCCLRAGNFSRVIQHGAGGIAPGVDQDLFRQVGH